VTKKAKAPSCAHCDVPPRERSCMTRDGRPGERCPTLGKGRLSAKARAEYHNGDVGEFARQASIQEAECYAGRDQQPYIRHPVKPRIVEVMEFADKMGYRRLGLAFCLGLAREASVVSELFESHGFEVVSVACKAGCVPKEELGLGETEKVFIGTFETMCNPIFQAMIVNEEKTDFNVLLGLCVGHDSLFLKYAEAPSTVLAVKDRLLGHNPLAAVWTAHSFYSWLKKP
jgi:uncharacterized metal-binding protein